MKTIFIMSVMVITVVIAVTMAGYLIGSIRDVKRGRRLKDWRFTIDYLSENDDCIRALRRIIGLIDGTSRKVDIPESLGIIGAVYGSENTADGVIIEPVKIHRVERMGLRGPIDALRIVAWKLSQVKETYRVYTSAGIYYISFCDCAYETELVLNDTLEDVSSFDEFQVEPMRAVLRISLLQ